MILTGGVVSIVIPFYNLSAYIDGFWDAFRQTYSDVEYVLLDDGSTDDTWTKLQQLKRANLDKKIVLYHVSTNRGVGAIRNIGLSLCSGQYVCSWDGDDSVDPHYVEKMVQKLQEEQADFVCCGFEYRHHGFVDLQKLDRLTQEPRPSLDEIQEHVLSSVTSWCQPFIFNKLIARDFLQQHHIGFEDLHVYEDQCLTMRLVLSAKKIAVVPDCLYRYIERGSSVMTSRKNLQRLYALFPLLEHKLQILEQYGWRERLYQEWVLHCWRLFFSFLGWGQIVAEFNGDIEVKREFLTRAQLFCRQHDIKLQSEQLPFGSTRPVYQDLPSTGKHAAAYKELKYRYQLHQFVRRFNALCAQVLPAGA